MKGRAERLQRRLRFTDAYALAVGSVIGTGIFFLPGLAAAAMGPAAVLALVIGALLASAVALCYAEAASRFDDTGGAMRYAQAAFGDLVALEVGWATWIARVVSWAALAHAFVTAAAALWPDIERLRMVVIAVLFTVLTAINLAGVRSGGRANTTLTAAKLVPLLAFVVLGAFAIDPARFEPFAPSGYAELGSTTVLMLYAYVGFEGMVIPAAEVRDARRVLPRALRAGIATVLVLYLGVWAVCTGTLATLAGSENPVGEAAAVFLGPTAAVAVELGIVVSVLGINAFMALVTPRALYALGHDGLLPTWLGGVGPRQVPSRAIAITAGCAFLLALTHGFEQLVVVSVVARLAQYVPTCLAVLRLRRLPGVPPARYRAPGGSWLPWGAVAVCAWLLVETPAEELLWGALAVGAGLLWWLLGKVRR